MEPNLKPVDRQVMVITGASSGIGLATAQAAAKAGAKIVMVSRDADSMRKSADELRAKGAQIVTVSADVGKAEDVKRVAEEAVRAYGRIDTWVNNAGVDLFGKLMEVPEEDSRRLFDTNFWGMVNGSRTAVEHLREKGGALINIGSVAGDQAFPLQGIYSASKHAVRAFTEALRMELMAEAAPISVTLIKPSSIGTPLPRQAKNYLAREPKLPGPLYAPEEVANAVLYAAVNPVRDIYVGAAGRTMVNFALALPWLGDIIASRMLIPAQKSNRLSRPRNDNLHEAGQLHGVVRSDSENRMIRPSLSTRFALQPPAARLAMTLGGLALMMLLPRGGKRQRMDARSTRRRAF
jgi:NADP-dependent 3-hydroxy acid dehydrogenase YdfG